MAADQGDLTSEKVPLDDPIVSTFPMPSDIVEAVKSKNGEVFSSSFHNSSSSSSSPSPAKIEIHDPFSPSTIHTNDINSTPEISSATEESTISLKNLHNDGLEWDDDASLKKMSDKCLNHNTGSSEGATVGDKSQFSSENQVSEVSTTLEVRIKSDYIFTDTVSINEKKELKANIISDSVKLELDDFSEGVSLGGVNPHGEDGKLLNESGIVVEEDSKCCENPLVGGGDSTRTDMGINNDVSEVAYSEKLNLDRSSGEDSMEEDPMDVKQICSIGYENLSGKTTFAAVREESFVDVVGEGLPIGEEAVSAGDDQILASRMKRKFHVDKGVDNKEELSKRLQTEKHKYFQPKHNLSLSDSAATAGAHEERSVPPSPKSPTNSLRIDRFLRPFTLKAVQEFLGKTGNIVNFWMDPIKTHCYITYSSIQEAVDTRNALYNLQWPPNRGHLLVAEFVDQQEVKIRMELPPQTALLPPIGSNHAISASPLPPLLPTIHQQLQHCNQMTIPPPPPPLLPIPKLMEWLPPPPPLPLRPVPPLLPTLDDLFQKTKTQPRVYYLPLSDEEVAEKRGRNNNDDDGNIITT